MKRNRENLFIRMWVEVVAGLYALLIIYFSLLPFDFSRDVDEPATTTWFGIHLSASNVPDAISNLAVYLPLGVLLSAAFVRRRVRGLNAIIVTLLIAAGISCCMELAQTRLASRMSSVADVVCNILGAAVGIILYTPETALLRRCARALRKDLSTNPVGVLAFGWGAMAVTTALVPFDFTIDVSHVAKAARVAELVPFRVHHDLAMLAAALPTDDSPDVHNVAIALWHLRIDYVADVFTFGVLALLLARYRRGKGRGWFSAAATAFPVAVVLAVVTTALELFVMSVGFDATRIVTRSIGCLLGTVLARSILDKWLAGSPGAALAPWDRLRRPLMAGFVVCVVYIGMRELAPFKMDTLQFSQKLAKIEWLPMHAYSLSKLPGVVQDMLPKSFRYVALGIVAILLVLVRGGTVGFGHRLRIGFCAAAGVTVLEFAQIWLPGRIPATTDVIIAWVMTAAGVRIGEMLYKLGESGLREKRQEHVGSVSLNVDIPPPSGDSSSAKTVSPRHISGR